MCACAVTRSVSRHAVSICNLYRVHCKLPFQMLSSPRYSCDSNWFYSGMSRNQMVVLSRQRIASAQMFKSCARPYSLMDASNTRFDCPTQENCDLNCAAIDSRERFPDLDYYGTLSVQQIGIISLNTSKRTLFSHRPVACADDLLTYIRVMQQRCMVSCSFHNSTRCMSQKPDKDSNQKPTASQLRNTQQMMMQQVIQFLQCDAVHCVVLLWQFCLSACLSLTLMICVKTDKCRVPPGHGKSWNLGRPFSRPGKSWKIAKVIENHGN